MSLQFSDTSNNRGIVQLIYANTGADSVKYPLKDIVRDVNLSFDRVLSLILTASGKWQFDDSNQTDYPIITTDLVLGQRDYSFTTDETGNLVLDIYKVMVKDPSGKFIDILPVDQQTVADMPGQNWNSSSGIPPSTMTDGLDTQGVPTCYDKTANGIFLDLVPSYNSTGGLKVFINREPTYFTTSDTTKKPGFAGIFHEYLALRPSFMYATRKNLINRDSIQAEMLRMEYEIKNYYGKRDKDTRKRFSSRIEWDR